MENYLNQIKSIFSKSGKNKIAIIGKGQSVSDIKLDLLKDFFIININDSEKLLPGDLALFYRPDFFDQIKNNNFKAKHYLAPSYIKIPDHKHIEVKYAPFGKESFEYTYDYFLEENFYLTDYIILSTIKLSVVFQKEIRKPLEVYFLGFDFYAASINSGDYEMHDLQYKNVVLKTQESYFADILNSFTEQYPTISLNHIGDKNYSKFTVKNFNNYLLNIQNETRARGKASNSTMYRNLIEEVKETNKVIVVAEFTNNHIGDPNRLIKMIELAKESGADMVKLQKRDVNTFYTPDELLKPYSSPFGKTLGAYRNGVELDTELFDLVDAECRKNEIPWFTSVLDWHSYEFMLQFDTVLIKLPSTISNHKNYLLKVGQDFKGDLVISTGFTDKQYESFVLENFLENRNLFLLQCTSSYPTPPEACQIAVVRHYDELSQSQYPNLYP